MKKWNFSEIKLTPILVSVLTMVGLTGCDKTLADFEEWLNSSPRPTPSVTPSPSPSPTGSASPSPTPSVSPSPKPTPTPTPSPSPTNSDLYVGPIELERYVMKFVDDGKAQGVDVLPDMKNPKLQIRVASLDQYGTSVIGLCESSGSLRRVTFDPEFWNTVTETQRELLAHHELGHCVLYRPHKTDVLSTGAYASIMYPVIMSGSTYLANYLYYQSELFARAASYLNDRPTNWDITHICNYSDLNLPPR